jgi:hypothetical protein
MAKTVVFIPCSKKKGPMLMNVPDVGINNGDIPNTWTNFVTGRRVMQHCINLGPWLTPGLYLYRGGLYNRLRNIGCLDNLFQRCLDDEIRIYIISGGYGLVDAREHIHDYEQTLDPEIARQWNNYGLVDTIAELLSTIKPKMVFGYLPGQNYERAPYRQFFTKGLKRAVENGLQVESGGCFYNASGQGIPAILGALGMTLGNHFENNFSREYATTVYNTPIQEGNVTITFNRIVE